MIDRHGSGESGGRLQDPYWPEEQPRVLFTSESRQAARERVRLGRAWRRHSMLMVLLVLACLVIVTMAGLFTLRLM